MAAFETSSKEIFFTQEPIPTSGSQEAPSVLVFWEVRGGRITLKHEPGAAGTVRSRSAQGLASSVFLSALSKLHLVFLGYSSSQEEKPEP